MWAFVIVVLDEFPVQRQPRMFQIVGSEPAFDLALRRRLADAAEDVLDVLLLAVRVEFGFSSAYAPEL